jgi:Spy/CpxP family protein refolding chaperone
MRNTIVAGLAALAIMAATAPANAQARRQNPQRAAKLAAATVPVTLLDTICKLQPAQKEKIEAIQTKLAEDMKALRPARGATPDPQAAQKRRDLNQAATTEITNILTPEQKDALQKAVPGLTMLRSAGVPLEVVADLKLTDDQKKQMQAIVVGIREDLKSLPAEERRAKMREKMTDARTKIEALLTPEQKEVLQKHRQKTRGAGRRNKP